jgi:hypothetical protein
VKEAGGLRNSLTRPDGGQFKTAAKIMCQSRVEYLSKNCNEIIYSGIAINPVCLLQKFGRMRYRIQLCYRRAGSELQDFRMKAIAVPEL